jgi:hypothetical protein
MLGVEERAVLTKHLTDGCPAGGPWEVLLFSGGGNDIVGNPMALWVKDWNAAIPLADHLKKPRFDAALALVRAAYEDLIALRNQLRPTTHLIFQGYDFAIPDGRGICGLGPWLKPTFDLCKFPTLAAGQALVKAMLQQFSAMLTSLTGPKVTVINGQGTLAPQTSSWHNELHPAKAGFEKFADIFQLKLKNCFRTASLNRNRSPECRRRPSGGTPRKWNRWESRCVRGALLHQEKGRNLQKFPVLLRFHWRNTT